MALVYELKFPNGKSYFGLTTKTIEHRVYQHKATARFGSKLPVHAAIRKYESFQVQVLDDDLTLEDAIVLEKQVIRNFFNRCYNLTTGGEGRVGVKHSPATRQKMSKAQKRRAQDPDWRKRLQTLNPHGRRGSKSTLEIP